MKHLFLLCFCWLGWAGWVANARQVNPEQPTTLHETIYTASDSLEVVDLLRKYSDSSASDDVLAFARHFIGRPYVAHTLEVADPECLVVNLQGLDCTTYVETVLALTMTKRQKSDKFADFCRNLERIRYFNGRRSGYLSRLHYFTWWMHDNLQKGVVTEVPVGRKFRAPIKVNNYYMSRHASAYKMLVAHPEWTDSIRALERKFNGPDGYYLSEEHTALGKAYLGEIQNGDIIAIVTTKAGLDYSHLGFAVWGKDGCLHLLNASSLYDHVVEDKNTLRKYLARQKSATGIRLLRLR